MPGFIRALRRLFLGPAVLRRPPLGRALVAIAVSGALLAPASVAGSATDEPAAVEVSVSSTSFWPAPEDGGQKLTVSFMAPVAGEYEIRLYGVADATFHEFGTLEPGTYSWAWDGRNRKGELFDRQRFQMQVYSWRGDHWADEVTIPIQLRRSFDQDYVSDNTGEMGAGHVDLDKWTLTTDHRAVSVKYDFLPGYRKETLFILQAALDVSRLGKGYLVTVGRAGRNEDGKLKPHLDLAWLASDQGIPEPVRCPGLRVQHEKRALTLVIPRKCMAKGGPAVRGNGWLSDIHGHYDGFPDAGDGYYWSDWVRYDAPPR